jgi:hypothetical protein
MLTCCLSVLQLPWAEELPFHLFDRLDLGPVGAFCERGDVSYFSRRSKRFIVSRLVGRCGCKFNVQLRSNRRLGIQERREVRVERAAIRVLRLATTGTGRTANRSLSSPAPSSRTGIFLHKLLHRHQEHHPGGDKARALGDDVTNDSRSREQGGAGDYPDPERSDVLHVGAAVSSRCAACDESLLCYLKVRRGCLLSSGKIY